MPLPGDVIRPGRGWQPYTPQWTAATTNPSIGDGSIDARWQQDSNTVTVAGRILMGSTTSYGAGTWLLSLPVPAGAAFAGAGAVYLHRASTVTARRPAVCWLGNVAALAFNSDAGQISSSVPFSWAAGDQVRFTFTYETAA